MDPPMQNIFTTTWTYHPFFSTPAAPLAIYQLMLCSPVFREASSFDLFRNQGISVLTSKSFLRSEGLRMTSITSLYLIIRFSIAPQARSKCSIPDPVRHQGILRCTPIKAIRCREVSWQIAIWIGNFSRVDWALQITFVQYIGSGN